MTDATDDMNPPRWAPNPDDPGQLRWWDGERWTDRTAPARLGPEQTRWEYTIREIALTSRWTGKGMQEERRKMLEALNDAGAHGWELVSYQAVPVTSGATVQSHAYMAMFKRPMAE